MEGMQEFKSKNSKMFFDIFLNKDEDRVYCGKLTSPVFEEEFEFYGLDEMILIMDEIMDRCNRPIRDDRFRTFSSNYIRVKNIHVKEFDQSLERNRMQKKQSEYTHDFFITVSYRQYNSWQGNISSLTKGYSKNFRSALEFIKLLDSAIH